MFSIKSTSSDREIIFSNRKGDYFRVELKGKVSVAVDVCAYTDAAGLNELFQKLGSLDKPWKNDLSWESLEGEFRISVSCSPLGEVQLNISLWGMPGGSEEWRVEAALVTEFGQLQTIAKNSNRFFS